MIFWGLLGSFCLIEVGYSLFSDHSYFWFANAEQTQAAILAYGMFHLVPYQDTKKKLVTLLLAAWEASLVVIDWSSVVSVWTMIFVFIVVSVVGAHGIGKVISVQSKPPSD